MKKFPYWKKLLSYFWEFKLENIVSDFSGEMQVSFHQNNLKLSTKNAIYSFGNQYTSFKYAFENIQIQDQKIYSVLILGLGLGSIIQQLQNHQEIQHITAVEIDSKIIYLCKKYLNTKFNIHYIHQDALEFMQKNNQHYDLVLIDIFIDDKTPHQFLKENFLLHLKNALNENGILLYSKLEISIENKIENDVFSKSFTQIFPNAFSISTDGNKIFVCRNNS
jgi:spermidine synthase